MCLGDPMMTMAQRCVDPMDLLEQARSGDDEARGILLDRYRNYLNLLARSLIGGALRVNLDASDLVQQTLLEAYRDLPQFHGSGEPELAAWLRQILIHNLANQAEYHKRQKRGLKKRISFDDLLERSSQFVDRAHAGLTASPSQLAVRREQAVQLADALARLPEDQRSSAGTPPPPGAQRARGEPGDGPHGPGRHGPDLSRDENLACLSEH